MVQSQATQAHLQEQGTILDGALQHLQEAQRRLSAQADPNRAGQELSAGREGVEQASKLNQTVEHDVTELSNSASSLQKQIDNHRNDWLGPRARRVRNRVIFLAILISIGAALLKLGPLVGGPFGGGAIVAGHVLTAFALPLIRGAWKLLGYACSGTVKSARWAVDELTSLAESKTSTAAPSPPAAGAPASGGGAANAAA